MSGEEPEENSMEYWRTKSIKLEKVIKTLSNHCVRVIEKHEELLWKFTKNQEQYNKLKAKFQEKGEQIKKARDVLIPVSAELTTLREKYEIAVRCQMEAESFAIKTTSKNKELKRQSQMLGAKLGAMNIVDINLDDNNDGDGEEEKEYIEKLGRQIDDLEEQKSALTAQVKELMENYDVEKESNNHLKEKIEHLRAELKQSKLMIKNQEELLQHVETTSEKAYKEYESMEQTYRKEIDVRIEAERFAQKLFNERNQARRESALALSKISDNTKLMKAMEEIQDLNTQMASLKDEYDTKIIQLEDQLKAAKEVYNAESLEAENEELLSEKNVLQEKVEERGAEIKKLHEEYSDLMEKYKTLEEKYESATRAPPPPPPPAPPPPPLPQQKSGGFLQRIVGRKGQRERAKEQLKKGGVSLDDNHSKAVEEMMKRIKSGNIGLKPVLSRQADDDLQSLPERENPSAMVELQGILTKMKKCRSDDDLSVFEETGVDETSELGKILMKRQQVIQENQGKDSSSLQMVTRARPVPQPRKLSTIKDEEGE